MRHATTELTPTAGRCRRPRGRHGDLCARGARTGGHDHLPGVPPCGDAIAVPRSAPPVVQCGMRRRRQQLEQSRADAADAPAPTRRAGDINDTGCTSASQHPETRMPDLGQSGALAPGTDSHLASTAGSPDGQRPPSPWPSRSAVNQAAWRTPVWLQRTSTWSPTGTAPWEHRHRPWRHARLCAAQGGEGGR